MIKVTAGILEKDGLILIAKRKKGDPMENKWEFPGGKLEGDETPEAGLKRELWEELGIEVAVGEFIGSSPYSYSHIAIELLAYRVRWLSGEIRLNDHEEIRWVSPDDLMGYDFPEADRPILHKLMAEGRGQARPGVQT